MARLLRTTLVGLLALHIAWILVLPNASLARDLYLYNLIWLLAVTLVLTAPLEWDRVALGALLLSLTFWGAGSLIASLAELDFAGAEQRTLTQVAYTLFYPLLLIALPRISSVPTKINSLELLDAAIFGIGFTSITATVLLTIVFPADTLFVSKDFFTIFYPVGDVALLLVANTQIVIRGWSRQRAVFLLGISIFAATDIYYLWLALHHRYSFASLADDGWLIAIAILAIAPHIKSEKSNDIQPIHPALIATSIFVSPILLALSALRPDIFPIYIVGLLIANLLLALIRMSTALRHARILNDERVLARTDELTGLANRRRLLTEIDNFSEIEGALMLLDLDGFKPINDEHGHETGDKVLREVARRFNRSLPHGAFLARLGGDEFGVLVRGSYEEALEGAYALRACLSYPFVIDGKQISVGVSIGIVHNDGAGELLKRADAAMYQAKQMGMGVAQL